MSPPGQAREDDLVHTLESLDKLSLEELLNSTVTSATRTENAQRSTAGIMTVVTREEILSSGARDLVDVLHRVPGFAFGEDVEGAIGLGFRGMWGYEGKILLQIDGHEINELLYLLTQFGNEMALDQIERIEIVRGPGSAVYGGFAELGVINVITRRGNQIKGASAYFTLGVQGKEVSRRNLSLSLGESWETLGLTVAASAFLGEAVRSSGEFEDYYGTRFSMAESSSLNPAMVNLNVGLRGLTVGFLFGDFRQQDRTAFGVSLPRAAKMTSTGYYLNVSYDAQLTEGMKLTPAFRYKRQLPWRVTEEDPEIRDAMYLDKTAIRYEGSLTLSWELLKGLKVLAGGVGYLDRANLNDPALGDIGLNYSYSGKPSVEYNNVAGFAQVGFENPIADITAGARFEHHSSYGNSFVPRVGLTRVLGSFHAKALVAGAFKAPGIENISINPEIKPERTWSYEVEVGYLLANRVFFSLSGFHMRLTDPIVYGVDPATQAEQYYNDTQTGSTGLEALVRYRHERLDVSLGYSFYTAQGVNRVAAYEVPGDTGALLSFPNHKLVLDGRMEILPKLTLSTTVVGLGSRYYTRYSVSGLDEDGNVALGSPAYESSPPVVLWDVFVHYRGVPIQGLSVGAGVSNILGQDYRYLPAYDSTVAPLPGLGRELCLRIGYEH
ncbi:MAG: TonB-dependent receptor [Deltaproteobacteria bacterium]|nr:TonB-dependent receptor [Deltaproteobacteria bacterium]